VCHDVEGCQSAMWWLHADYKEPNRAAASKGH
jgi:sulfur transfer protein SufE